MEGLPHLKDSILLLLLAASALTDIGDRKILNALTYPAIVVGLVLNLLDGPAGLGSSAVGCLAGFAFLYPLYRIEGMGMGDLKLMGAVGALEGMPFVFSSLICTALACGFLAVVVMVQRGRIKQTLKRSLAVTVELFLPHGSVRPARVPQHDTIPYGVAIGLGSLMAWWLRWPW